MFTKLRCARAPLLSNHKKSINGEIFVLLSICTLKQQCCKHDSLMLFLAASFSLRLVKVSLESNHFNLMLNLAQKVIFSSWNWPSSRTSMLSVTSVRLVKLLIGGYSFLYRLKSTMTSSQLDSSLRSSQSATSSQRFSRGMHNPELHPNSWSLHWVKSRFLSVNLIQTKFVNSQLVDHWFFYQGGTLH